ncbi:MAG TPA: MFS transporter [Steroidobacteraceae bacterium]|nr:MFS transporter [Steroidobacteraceae bacterium]
MIGGIRMAGVMGTIGCMSIDADAIIRRAQRRLLTPLLALLFLSTVDRANISFAALQMNAELGLDAETYGFGVSIFFVGYILIQWPSLWLLQRLGMRRWVFACAGLWGLAAAGLAFVHSAHGFYALRLLLGVAEGGFAPGVMLYLSQWIPARGRAAAISTFMLAVPTSAILGGPLAGWLMSVDNPVGWPGWRWMLLIEGMPTLLLAIAALRLLPDAPRDARWLGPDERRWLEEEMAREKAAQATHTRARLPIGNRQLWVASLCWFGLMVGAQGLLYWLPQILRHLSAGSSDLRIGVLTALPWIAVAAGMVLNARHSDRRQERHWHVGLAALAAGVFIALTPLLGTGGWALASLLIAGLAMGAAQGTFWTLPPLFLGASQLAAGFALINMCGNLAGLVIPAFIGWVRVRTGSFDGPVYALAALSLLAAGAVALLRARPAKSPPAIKASYGG